MKLSDFYKDHILHVHIKEETVFLALETPWQLLVNAILV